jgi:hypothetical protein
VLICQIIAIFSGQGKTLQRFKVRVLKITRAFSDFVLQYAVLPLKLCVKLPVLKQILDSQQDFDHAKGLHHKVRGAARERASFGFWRRIGRQHEDRKGLSRGDQRSQRVHDRKSIDVRHHKVEEQEVGVPLRVAR